MARWQGMIMPYRQGRWGYGQVILMERANYSPRVDVPTGLIRVVERWVWLGGGFKVKGLLTRPCMDCVM